MAVCARLRMPGEPVNPESPVIEMRGVAVTSMQDPSRVLVENVNWTVNSGEFWVIAGAQGSGRSDLMLLAGGLMSPADGEYQFIGEPMPIFEESRLRHRLRLGFVFETGQVFSEMTTAENLALPLQYHEHVSREQAELRVSELLEFVEMTRFANHFPSGLTRNWQKRVGLARALMLKPEVLVLDEPLSGLNARHAAWWINFLGQLQAGTEFFGGRPITIIAGVDDLRPWQDTNRCFAVVTEKNFCTIGSHDKLTASTDPVVKEFVFGSAPPEKSDRNEKPTS